MTFELLAALIGIAVFDSLNPSLFFAQFYLFATPNPVPRILTYLAGVMAVMVVGGILLVAGVGALIGEVVRSISPQIGILLQLGLGVMLLIFGVRYRAQPSSEGGEVKKPRSLSLGASFLFGMAVMGNELTTALPYFLAIERISSAGMDWVGNLIALGVYNFVFALPLLIFVGLFVKLRGRFTAQLERISEWVRRWTPRIIKYGALIFGVVLVLNAGAWFVSEAGLLG
jgi:cytochrome c biogenesis protein CcdA